MRRNHFVFLGLLPLVLLCAIAIPVRWGVMLLLITIGMFPISLLLGLVTVPLFISLTTWSSVGLMSLWISLLSQRKILWLTAFVPLSFIPVCLYLGQFLAEWVAKEDANYLYLDLEVLAFQAHLIFSPLVLILIAFVFLNKTDAESIQSGPSRFSVSRLPILLLGSMAVLGCWFASAYAIEFTQGDVKRYMLRIKEEQKNVIDTDNRSSVVVALCAGKLEQVKEILAEDTLEMSGGDLHSMISTCLRKKDGVVKNEKSGTLLYPQRVEILLEAIQIYEQKKSIIANDRCGEYRGRLLQKIFENQADATVLSLFFERGLPITCKVKVADGESYPAWWWIAYRPVVKYEQLLLLEKFGVSLLETDHVGTQFLSHDSNHFHEYADDSALLHMIRTGLETKFIRPATAPLSLEVMRRRFGIRYHPTETQDFAKLLEAVGEPTLEQLQDVKSGKWYEMIPNDKRFEKQAMELSDYIDARIRKLQAKK